MFKCGSCGRMTVAREKATHTTVETRKVTYECGSVGTEIVKEILVCQQCAINNAKENEKQEG